MSVKGLSLVVQVDEKNGVFEGLGLYFFLIVVV